jgi:hypothetical protein
LSDSPDPFGFVEPFERHFSPWGEVETFADCELTDTVRDDDLSGVAEIADAACLGDDGPVDVPVLLDWFPGCHANPELQGTITACVLQVESERNR